MTAFSTENHGYQRRDERAGRAYRDSVAAGLGFLKSTTALDELMAKSIPLEDDRGWLIPVTYLHAEDEGLISSLSSWRQENQDAFPSRFTVTEDGTRSWLATQVLEKADRMLFMVADSQGKHLGHIGLANTLNDAGVMELDNVIRGIPGVEPGIMAAAVRALIAWAEETLWPDAFELKVLASNSRAIRFYRGLGFVDGGSEPMRWQDSAEGAQLVTIDSEDIESADDSLLTMAYAPTPRTEFEDMILTSGPSISGREIAYTLDAARNGWNRSWSSYIDRFEDAFGRYIGAEYSISTSSCTGALHIALLALGIGPGDEVIVPDLTWVATARAVQYVGATPVFADIQRDSMCMDPESFRALIGPKTKAVIPVHLYGHPSDMDSIVRIAREAGLFIVEDAAPAIGAECNGQRAGTFGDFAAFSFQGAKLLSTGEGGALVTNDAILYEKAHKIWDQGRNPDHVFWIDGLGVKYKMSNIQAALGLAQIERADAHIEAKRRLHGWYQEALEDIPGVTLCGESEWARSIHWMNTIQTDDDSGHVRDDLRAWLKTRNIDTRPVFPAISDYPIWPRAAGGPIAHSVGARGINLPSGLWLRRDHVDYIARNVREFFSDARGTIPR